VKKLFPGAGSPEPREPEAIWFGPLERPLAGVLHRPAGRPGGGVLICPPFGYELTCAYRPLRILGERLAADGNLVLRFDYEGTGASSGSGLEADLLSRWQQSVAAGIAELRRRGIAQPALIGLRLGAALACSAVAADPSVGPVVLWAPVTAGRRFQRELRAAAAITPGGVPGDGTLNPVGHVVSGPAAKSIAAWNPLVGVDPDHDLLVVQSPGWRDSDQARADFVAAGLAPTFIEVAGTKELLETDAELVKVPVQLFEQVCEWLAANRAAGPVAPFETPSEDDGSRRVFDAGSGCVAEEIVHIGPSGLHGVLTEPIGAARGCAVIFLNNGRASAVGPGRAWVEFARSLANEGITALRFDLRGLGDSPDARLQALINRDASTPKLAGPELIEAVHYLQNRGARVIVAAGLCSGAQIALRTAAHDGGIAGVFSINPPLYYQADIGVGPPGRRVWSVMAIPMGKSRLRTVAGRLPEALWVLLDRLRIYPSPTRALRAATARGASVSLVFAQGDNSIVDIYARDRKAFEQLVAEKTISSVVLDGMDHSLFDRQYRATVLEMLRDYCLDTATSRNLTE
jgi:alpha-beta hydrolase superfamily lysophospholipase